MIQGSWIQLANDNVKIADVLKLTGIEVPTSDPTGSKKIYCPFGPFYHSDKGYSKAMRVYYATNNVYCFSCTKRYSPVSLASAFWDCSWTVAAIRLLEDSGFKPKTLKERWAQATNQEVLKPDLIALAEALKVYCSSCCNDWTSVQYDASVADKLSKCLALLDHVDDQDKADRWLTTCKQAMNIILEKSK